MDAIIFQIQSGIILALMIFGITRHKKRMQHVKIMSLVIIWDILLILQIELNRGAIKKATDALQNLPVDKIMLNIHVSIAVTTVLLYLAMIYTGRKVLKGYPSLLERHRILGYSTLVMRVLTFVTSFFVV